MTYAAAPDALQGAVAAGILSCGSVILGASETAGRLFTEVAARVDAGEALDDVAADVIRTLKAERRSIPGLQAGRAEVILGGACIIRTVLVKLGHDAMTVSDRGLRHGVVIDRFGPPG